MPHHKRKLIFPKNFLWGTATSSHQIEGGNENNWTEWEQEDTIKDGTVSGRACNSWELYKEDIALAKELNNNAYRFGIEWSRVEPQQGRFDASALARYKDMVRECRKQGIEPFVTLYHWTQPLWFRDAGGWLNKRSPLYFKQYVERVVKELGHDVKFWVTINEPFIYSYNSYLIAKWPPAAQSKSSIKRLSEFLTVQNNLAKAHRLAYFALHDFGPCEVGVAKNNQYFEPYVASLFNRAAVYLAARYWNHSFLKKIEDTMDYVGINYYFHNRVYVTLTGYVQMNENKATNDLGWEIYPKGLYEVLMDVRRYDKPVYVLENGLADARDTRRAAFIRDHLKYVHQAIKDGTDVRGYFHWSLIDNFEWSEGFEPRFGLYEVDFETFERTPRPSAKVYAAIAKNNGL